MLSLFGILSLAAGHLLPWRDSVVVVDWDLMKDPGLHVHVLIILDVVTVKVPAGDVLD